jgi:hypothetical protein
MQPHTAIHLKVKHWLIGEVFRFIGILPLNMLQILPVLQWSSENLLNLTVRALAHTWWSSTCWVCNREKVMLLQCSQIHIGICTRKHTYMHHEAKHIYPSKFRRYSWTAARVGCVRCRNNACHLVYFMCHLSAKFNVRGLRFRVKCTAPDSVYFVCFVCSIDKAIMV